VCSSPAQPGIVGSALTRRLLDTGAYVVVLVRDWDPQSELVRTGDIQRTSVVNGRLEDYGSIERAINEHEIETVFHLGAQPIVTTALRNPLPTFEANIRGSYNLLEACRVHRSLVSSVVVASSDKAYGGRPDVCPTRKKCRSTGGTRTTSARAARICLP
jgi:CDP-glucose 4,6-dehydratase